MSIWLTVAQEISAVTGKRFVPGAIRTQGSPLNATAVLDDGERAFFVKCHDAGRLAMFEAEAAGLEALAGACALPVIRPVCSGLSGERAFLVLEYRTLEARNDAIDADLGRGLARLHALHGSRFGWHRNNTIGTNPQSNEPMDEWPAFFGQRRLVPQLRLAAGLGYQGRLQELGEALLTRLPALFAGYTPAASILHGDLWSGNAAACDGHPIVYDPAVYYGDRETDLAMTELFGGFSPDFYSAYAAAYPLDKGYQVRKTLYNLYHVLNHLNLFGGGYLSQAERMMARLLAEVGG